MPFRCWRCAPLSRSPDACCRFGERYVFPSRRHFTMREQNQQPLHISGQLSEVAGKDSTTNRWWIYQRERFPFAAHAPLIAAFSFSAISYSSLLRGRAIIPSLAAAAVAFLSATLSFLQLRLADEFKDFEEDSPYRPYPPIPPRPLNLQRRRCVCFYTPSLTVFLTL